MKIMPASANSRAELEMYVIFSGDVIYRREKNSSAHRAIVWGLVFFEMEIFSFWSFMYCTPPVIAELDFKIFNMDFSLP